MRNDCPGVKFDEVHALSGSPVMSWTTRSRLTNTTVSPFASVSSAGLNFIELITIVSVSADRLWDCVEQPFSVTKDRKRPEQMPGRSIQVFNLISFLNHFGMLKVRMKCRQNFL